MNDGLYVKLNKSFQKLQIELAELRARVLVGEKQAPHFARRGVGSRETAVHAVRNAGQVTTGHRVPDRIERTFEGKYGPFALPFLANDGEIRQFEFDDCILRYLPDRDDKEE